MKSTEKSTVHMSNANSPIVPNILPVNFVPESCGVYGRKSDLRWYAQLFILIAYSEFLLCFDTLPIQF